MSTMGGDDLTIHAELDNDVSPELREIRDDLRRVGTQAETTSRQASRSSRGFDVLRRAGKLAGTAIKASFVLALGVGYGLLRLTRSSLDEAREAQKVGRTTEAIIKSTGGAAKVSAKQVEGLATRLSLMAGVDDELIQTGANLLLTFKRVRNEQGKNNKVFDRATAAALDLSSAGFGSMDSASKMLGKALNDPLKGMTALGRAGVTFTEGQQDTIKALVESGDLLSAQKIILKEVESQVGGVAKAQATWSDKAGVYADNIKEKFGKALLPLFEDLSRWFVKDGGPALEGYVRTFRREGVPAIREFVDEAKPVAQKWLPKIADTLGTVGSVLKDAAGYAGDLVEAFLNMPGWARKAIVAGGLATALGSKLGVGNLVGSRKAGGSGLLGLVSKAKPLPVFITNPGFSAGGGGRGPRGAVVPVGGEDIDRSSKDARRRNAAKGLGVAGLVLTLSNPSDLKESAGVLGDNLNAWAKLISDPILERQRRDTTPTPSYMQNLPANATITDATIAKQRELLDLAERTALLNPYAAKGYREQADELGRILEVGQKTQPFMDSLFQDTVVPGISSVKALNDENAVLASAKPAPVYSTPGLDKATTDTTAFGGILDSLTRPITTTINANTSPARSAVAQLGTQISNTLSSLGGLFGSSGSASTPTPTSPQTDALDRRGPSGRAAAGRGGVTVMPGGIVVQGAGLDADELEDAIVGALEKYEREQLERGGV